MAELGSFDALILDVMLPEGDNAGFEIARPARFPRHCTDSLSHRSRGHELEAQRSRGRRRRLPHQTP